MNTIVKMHEKVMENKNKELTNIKQKLKSSNIINQELSQKIEDLGMNKNVQDVIDKPREDCEPESDKEGNLAKFSVKVGKKKILKMEHKAEKKNKREGVSSPIQPYKCSECDLNFRFGKTLERHFSLAHIRKSFNDSTEALNKKGFCTAFCEPSVGKDENKKMLKKFMR